MPYKNVVLAGMGSVGRHILVGLLAGGAKVTVFSRSGRKTLVPGVEAGAGVTVIEVNYESEDALVAALRSAGAEVVVSALSQGGFAAQPALARAAKKAGVKLFVPSEYGNPTTGYTPQTSPVLSGKAKVQDLLKAIDLPYALFFAGLFMDFIPLVTHFNTKEKMATIAGMGRTPISFTAMEDVGRFVGHAVTTLPEKDLAWRTFRIEGERKTFIQVFDILSAVLGSPIRHTLRDPDTVLEEAASKGMPDSFLDWLLVAMERGKGSVSWDESTGQADKPVDNGVWPKWNPQSVTAVMESKFKK
jgi:uncharacterized protein YbjT (DUF2867 family)